MIPCKAALSLLIVILLVFVPAPSLANIIYVDIDAAGLNDGSSWTDALTDLQDALGIAQAGDEVWVAEGTYRPASGTDRNSTFRLLEGVKLYGGFRATESSIDQRDWSVATTFLDGAIGAPDPSPYTVGNDVYHVLSALEVDSTAVIDGFIIQHGYADSGSSGGGGLYVLDASPTVRNTTISQNLCNGPGGGAFLDGLSRPLFENVSFEANTSSYIGGAVSVGPDAYPRFSNVRFLGNSDLYCAGGVCGDGDFSSVQFTGNWSDEGAGGLQGNGSLVDVLFENNVTYTSTGIPIAGGMVGRGDLTNVIFRANGCFAAECAGGLVGGGTLSNVLFDSNQGWVAGGMWDQRGGSLLVNVAFQNNEANYAAYYAGVSPFSSPPTIPPPTTTRMVNATFARNQGAGIYSDDVALTIENTILWDNSRGAEDYREVVLGEPTLASVSHSIIMGSGGSGPAWDDTLGVDAGDNIDANPLFLDASSSDLRLAPCSPGIDAGDSIAVLDGIVADLAGNDRIQDAAVDIGAYESNHGVGPFVLYVDSAAVDGGGGASWESALPDLQAGLSAASTCPETSELWVAEGTYKPTSGSDQTISFELKSGVAIYGGFRGDEASREQRDWQVNETILSGDIGLPMTDAQLAVLESRPHSNDKDDILLWYQDRKEKLGTMFTSEECSLSYDDNSAHVLRAANVDSTAILDGFVVQHGGVGVMECPPPSVPYVGTGCGLLNIRSSPTLRNLVFQDNGTYWDTDGAGAMANLDGSSPLLEDIMFDGNFNMAVGGVLNVDSSPTLRRVTFLYCYGDWGVGGMYSEGASLPVLEGVDFVSGLGWTGPGGMSGSVASMTDVRFDNNQVLGDAPGALVLTGDALLQDVEFLHNQPHYLEGSVWLKGSPTLVNAVFKDDALYVTGNSNLINATFLRREPGWNPALRNNGGGPELHNVIIWDDFVGAESPIIVNENGDARIADSLVQGSNGSGDAWNDSLGVDLGGNIDAHPLFVDSGNDNLTVAICSPVIDAGDDSALPPDVLTDIAGNPRFQGASVDIGAYESREAVGPFVVYVDSSANGPADGADWDTAFTDLQVGLSAATACPGGAELWVARGTYKPTSGTDRTATFQLISGVQVYGGFAGYESSREQRNWAVNETILSGDIGNPGKVLSAEWAAILDPDASRAERMGAFEKWRDHVESVREGISEPLKTEDNSRHVVTGSGTDSTAVLDGFSVTGGYIFGQADVPYGAGILNVSGSPTLCNLLIDGNHNVYGSGGGVANLEGSDARFRSLVIAGNEGFYEGGGVYNKASSPTFVHVDIATNGWSVRGGGMMSREGSSPILENVSFVGNNSTDGGGGMCQLGGSPELRRVTFIDNWDGFGGSTRAGGGLWLEGEGTLSDLVFSGNLSEGGLPGGGGMYASGDFTLTNAMFYGNSAAGAPSGAGGLTIYGGTPVVRNVTVGGNEDGGIVVYDADPSFHNSIIWGNVDSNGTVRSVSVENAIPSFSHCDIQGWSDSLGADLGGNIDADPLFVDQAGGNLRIKVGSPVINAGDTSAVPDGILTDLDGNPRVVGEAVDMGAYELVDQLDIRSILDVANDQGRSVRISFAAASLDTLNSPNPVLQYEAFRRIDPLGKMISNEGSEAVSSPLKERVERARDSGMLSDTKILSQGWDYAGAVPAHARPSYNMIAPTLADSTIAEGMHWSVFFLRAATASPGAYYDSAPDSGYSLDNLAPSAPGGVLVAYHWGDYGHNTVSWEWPIEEDVRFFLVYRESDGSMISAAVVDTTVSNTWQDLDDHTSQVSYFVSAVDFSGNEGEPGFPELRTTAPETSARRFALHRAVPNPFNPSTQIQFELPTSGAVTLTVYDLSGRLVKTLVDETLGAGIHLVIWNGKDDAGRQVASGVYHYQLKAGDSVETQRMVLLK